MTAGETSCSCTECGVVCTGRFAGCVSVWRRGPRPVSAITFTARRPDDARPPELPRDEGPLLEAATARYAGSAAVPPPGPMDVRAAPAPATPPPAPATPTGPAAVEASGAVNQSAPSPAGPAPRGAPASPAPPAATVAPSGDKPSGPATRGHTRPHVGAGRPLVAAGHTPKPHPPAPAAAPEASVAPTPAGPGADLSGAGSPPPSPPLPEPARPDVAVRFVVERLNEFGDEVRRLTETTSTALSGYGAEQEGTAAAIREALAESTATLGHFSAAMAKVSSDFTTALSELALAASRSADLTQAVERMQDQISDLADSVADPVYGGDDAAADRIRLAVVESSKSLDRLAGAVGAISTDLGAVLGDTVDGALSTLEEVRELATSSSMLTTRLVDGLGDVRALREEIAELRAELASLADELAEPHPDDLHHHAAAPPPAAPAALLAGLDDIRAEIEGLRRRLPVSGKRTVALADDQVAYLVEAIAEATVTALGYQPAAAFEVAPPTEPDPAPEPEPAPRPRRRRPLRAQDSNQPGDDSNR